jgi:tetratricopeptide (TPR) repeat protein
MDLTVDQALQQGVTAHKEGKLEEAEGLYRAILQSQPLHPDANHNLGLIVVSVNKADAALPFFKTALDTNPKIEQFWLSYIDALIEEKQFANARQIIEQAKKQGVAREKLNALEIQLIPTAQVNKPKLAVQKKSLTLSEKRKKLAEQKKHKKAKKQNLKAISPSDTEIKSLLEHYQNGRYDDAEKLAKSITQQFPEHQFGWTVLGAVLKQTGRVIDSLTAMQKSVKLAPQDAKAHYNLGNTLKELGRLDEAEASYKQVIALKPDYAEAHFNLGITLQELGRLDEAEASYKQAIVLKPDADAHCNLGIALQALDRLEEAEASYTQAIALEPDFALAHSNLGNTLNELGRLDEAEASYTQAIALKPDYAEVHHNLGNTLKELGRLDEAEASYTHAIALKPDYAEAHNNLGNTLQALDRLEEAEASYTQAIALKPDFALAHYNLGNTLKELGRLDESEASYNQAIALKPDFAEAHSNLGITLQELGRLDEAEASHTQAIALKPDNAEAYNNLGVTLKELGRFDEAEASYTRAIELNPDYAEALMNRWQLLFDKKEFDAALRDIDLCDTQTSRACSLETLYALGRIGEIYKRIEMQVELDDGNLRMAALSSFISEREKKNTAHKFCQNPLSFIHFSNISTHLEDASKFVKGVIEELNEVATIWEPDGKTTVKGFQTLKHINLFANPLEKMTQLKSIILNELDAYYLKFQNEPCSFIRKWPSKKNLRGWHVILKEQGFQDSHIHTSGWLSGVIYLKVVPPLKKDEGAIEFSLNSQNYSDLKSPRLLHQPTLGDIVFFPSSLHHRTIPFTTDTDRIIVSFDLMPRYAKEAKH